MHKKGTEPVIWIIIEAALITIAIISVFSYIRSVQDNELFMKKFLARDTALMIETVGSVPGDISYVYQDTKANLSRFTFKFADSRAEIARGTEVTPTDYPFYFDASLNKNLATVSDSRQLVFSKRGTSLAVGKELSAQYLTGCSAINTKDSLTLMILDPSDEDALKVATYLNKKVSIPVSITAQQKPFSEDERLLKITDDSDLVIGISYRSDGVNRVLYGSQNQDKAEKLACLILKHLALSGATSIPSTDRMLSKNTKGIAVRLEVDKAITDSQAANAINAAVREYNG
jgi:hypothetical protein